MASKTGEADHDRQPERPDEQAGFGPPPNTPPPALVSAVRGSHEVGSTLVLDVGGQNVIVVLGEDAGGINQMWTFIQQCLPDRKAVRM
jgi:hypothetical protein